MYFLVDIDNTIARRNTAWFLRKCASYLGLALPPDCSQDMTWKKWLELPEVVAYRLRLGETAWQWKLRCIALDPIYQRKMLPVKGAISGIWHLAQFGHVAYYTCRKTTFSAKWNEQMEEATRAWLAEYAFPSPKEVVFCTSPTEKLRAIAGLIGQTKQKVVLIDDLYDEILLSAEEIFEDHRDLLTEFFTLCAFRAESPPSSSSVQTVALSRWSQLETILDKFVVCDVVSSEMCCKETKEV